MRIRKLFSAATLFVVLALALAACGGKDDAATGAVTPAQTATNPDQASPTSTAVTVLPATSGADEGDLDAAFVADAITVNPGETFTKIWRIQNTGTVAWNSGEYAWKFVGGDQMNGPSQVPLASTVPPGAEYEVTMDLTAPAQPGQYEGRWQLHDPAGQPLGSEFGVRIEVPATPSADVEAPVAEPVTEAPASGSIGSEFVVPIDESPAPPADTGAPAAEPVAAAPSGELEEGCLDSAPVADVTIPDGTVLEPGETFTKIWRVQNAGTCEWSGASGEFQWVFIGGEQMRGPRQVSIASTVPAGSEYNVDVELTAPTQPGQYEGRWQIHGPDGEPIGVPFWVLIQVPEENPPAPPDDSPPSAAPGSPPPSGASSTAQEIWQQINGERDRHGLYQLAYNEKLALAAQRHAEDCSQRGSCSHTGSDGSDESVRVLRVGYQGTVDESWAMAAAPGDAVYWWLDEVPPNDWHRRMLLSDHLREVGVGVAPAGYGHYYIAVFGVAR